MWRAAHNRVAGCEIAIIEESLMTDPNDKYLFLAYGLVWIVFMLYAWSLWRRQARLRRDLEEMKANRPDLAADK